MLVNVAGFRASDATFQTEALHCLGIGVLKVREVFTGHKAVGTQTGSIARLGTITLPGFRFARLFLSLGGDYRHDCDMKVRCLLVHVEMCADIPHFPAIATPSAVVKLSGKSERTASCNSVNASSLMMPCTFDAVERKYSAKRKALSTVSTSISFFSPLHSVDEFWND